MKCSHCHRQYEEKSFRLDHNGQVGDRLYKTCNTCRSSARLRPRKSTPKRIAYWRQYSKTNRAKKLAYGYTKTNLCNKFGYDPDELANYNIAQSSIQNNCCVICGSKAKYLVLDHNHTTGQLRKMLCRKCNLGIGNLGDSVENCERAALYLANYLK